jgi:chromosomal replication initiation ATPase DnaA
MAFASLMAANPGQPPDHILAEMLRLELCEKSSDVNLKMSEMIIATVCKYYGITKPELIGGFPGARKLEFVRARQMACYHAVRFMPQHAFELHSGINRNTIQHNKTTCAILMETESDLRRECNEIAAQIDILKLGIQFEFIRELSPDPSADLAIINN